MRLPKCHSKTIKHRTFKKREPTPQSMPPLPTPQIMNGRIAKAIAHAGLCSRREAERWITAGRISVNGVTLTDPAINVSSGDHILIDQKPIPAHMPTRLWRYHKPRGLVTTHKDPEKRATIFENLPTSLPRVISVGRLDINTQGLMLLTNDGGLSHMLEHPSTKWRRNYRVRAFGDISQDTLNTLRKGISVDGINYGPIEAQLERKQGDNIWLSLVLREGKNREIKHILEHFGLKVNRMLRMSYGPFLLGNLAIGKVEEVKTHTLREQLGLRMIAEGKVRLSNKRKDRETMTEINLREQKS